MAYGCCFNGYSHLGHAGHVLKHSPKLNLFERSLVYAVGELVSPLPCKDVALDDHEPGYIKVRACLVSIYFIWDLVVH